MPRKCKVCAHGNTRQMETMYIKGKPKTHIARQFDVPTQSVDYHMDHHLTEKLVRTARKKEQKHAENILDGITDLLDRTQDILDEAEEDDQKTTALHAIREARNIYELLSKIAVKLEEYRREDEQKESHFLKQQATGGLQALSDTELELFTQLLAKIHAANPQHELNKEVRMFVDGVGRIWPEQKDGKTTKKTKTKAKADNFDASHQPDETRSDSARTRPVQNRNTSEDKDIDGLDLDLEDLDLTKDNTIPSEETDPDWLRRERRRRRRRNR